MTYANCEVYMNANGELGVLTRSGPRVTQTFLHNPTDPDDISINLDRRLVEFYLSKPNRHSYKEWDELMAECGYPSIFHLDYGKQLDSVYDTVDYDEIMRHQNDPVDDLEITWVPQNRLFHIVTDDDHDAYGNWIGVKQIVEVFCKDDFIET